MQYWFSRGFSKPTNWIPCPEIVGFNFLDEDSKSLGKRKDNSDKLDLFSEEYKSL